jgi:hypothetical protein
LTDHDFSDDDKQTSDVVDLGSVSASPSPAFETIKYDPAPQRESVRGRIALFLIILMAATILGSFAILWFHPDRDKELHELLSLIFGPLVALVGAATGYYFGSQAATKSQ